MGLMMSQSFPPDREHEHPFSCLGLTQYGHAQPETTGSKDIVKVKRHKQSPCLPVANARGPPNSHMPD